MIYKYSSHFIENVDESELCFMNQILYFFKNIYISWIDIRPLKGALTQCEVKAFSRLFWLFRNNNNCIINDKNCNILNNLLQLIMKQNA
jgi:hypothetical protein